MVHGQTEVRNTPVPLRQLGGCMDMGKKENSASPAPIRPHVYRVQFCKTNMCVHGQTFCRPHFGPTRLKGSRSHPTS